MIAMNALPPLGERDAEFDRAWRRRIEETPAWLVDWIRQQHDGPYWRNGSLRPDYGRIVCPVLICAGWRDGYRTAALRMARNLEAPWQLLAGPWAHKLPDRGVPGPRYPFLAEMARFFHRHLDEAGAADAATGRGRSSSSAARTRRCARTRWCRASGWRRSGGPRAFTARAFTLGGPATAPARRHHRDHDRPVVPAAAGDRPVPRPAPRRRAQRDVFDSEPLTAPVTVFGEPVVRFDCGIPGHARWSRSSSRTSPRTARHSRSRARQ